MFRRRRVLLLLAGIAALAAALRVFDIGAESLWLDEVWSARAARLSFAGIWDTCAQDVHPPLYTWILHAWTGAFGESEAALRSLSVAFSLLSLPLFHALGAALFRDRRAGLFAALLSAISAFHVFYAQETRSYALLLLLSVASMHALWRLSTTRRPAHAVAYALATAALLWVHAHALFVVAAQGAFVLAAAAARAGPRPPLRTWALAVLFAGLAFLPWLRALLSATQRVSAGYWIPPPTGATLLDTFAEFCGSNTSALVFVPLAAFALATRGGARGPRASRTLFLATWLAVPILLPFLLSQGRSSIFLPRAVIAASAPLFLLVGGALARLSRRASPRWLASAAVLVVVLASARGLAHLYGRVDKEQWHAAVAHVESLASPGDVVALSDLGEADAYRWYAERADLAVVVVQAADAAWPSGAAVWVVTSCHTLPEGEAALAKAAGANGRRPGEARRFHLVAVRAYRP